MPMLIKQVNDFLAFFELVSSDSALSLSTHRHCSLVLRRSEHGYLKFNQFAASCILLTKISGILVFDMVL